MLASLYAQLGILLFALALIVILVGPERIQAELYAFGLGIKAGALRLYAWILEKVIIRFVRVSGHTRILLLEARRRVTQRSIEARRRVTQRSIETSHRRAEYHKVCAEYWRTKARTTRRIRLLSLRLAGEISEDEYRNLLAKDRQDLELAMKRKQLAEDWVRGKMTETDYRQHIEAISQDE